MKEITLCCGRGKCPKLTLPVIEGKTYGPKDLFFLSDDYGNECRLTYDNLQHLAKTIKDLQKQK